MEREQLSDGSGTADAAATDPDRRPVPRDGRGGRAGRSVRDEPPDAEGRRPSEALERRARWGGRRRIRRVETQGGQGYRPRGVAVSRRAPAIKVAGILLTAVALVALTIYAWIRATESRRWREMEAALVALERQALSQPGVRPVLIGDPAAGNAWEHYRSAQEFIKGKVRTSLLGEIVSRSSKLDRDQIRSTIEPLGPAI